MVFENRKHALVVTKPRAQIEGAREVALGFVVLNDSVDDVGDGGVVAAPGTLPLAEVEHALADLPRMTFSRDEARCVVEGVEEARALVLPQRVDNEVVVNGVEEWNQEQNVLGLLVKAVLELRLKVSHDLVAQGSLPGGAFVTLDVGYRRSYGKGVALGGVRHALDELRRGGNSVCRQQVGDVGVGEEEVVRRDNEKLALGKEGREPARHGRAGEKDEARARAAGDNGCQSSALRVGNGVVDVVDKDSVVLLGSLCGNCLGDVDCGGVHLKHVHAFEHTVREL